MLKWLKGLLLVFLFATAAWITWTFAADVIDHTFCTYADWFQIGLFFTASVGVPVLFGALLGLLNSRPGATAVVLGWPLSLLANPAVTFPSRQTWAFLSVLLLSGVTAIGIASTLLSARAARNAAGVTPQRFIAAPLGWFSRRVAPWPIRVALALVCFALPVFVVRLTTVECACLECRAYCAKDYVWGIGTHTDLHEGKLLRYWLKAVDPRHRHRWIALESSETNWGPPRCYHHITYRSWGNPARRIPDECLVAALKEMRTPEQRLQFMRGLWEMGESHKWQALDEIVYMHAPARGSEVSSHSGCVKALKRLPIWPKGR